MHEGPIQLVQFLRLLDVLGDGWSAMVVLGLLAGFVARLVTTRERTIGLLSTCALGVAGALLGVGVARWAGLALDGNGLRFAAALAGSLVLAMLGGWLGGWLGRRPGARPSPAPAPPGPRSR